MPRIVVGEGLWEGGDSTVKVYAFKDGDFGIMCTCTKYDPPHKTKLLFGGPGLDGFLLAVKKAKTSKKKGKLGYVLTEPEPEMVWTQYKPLPQKEHE